MATQDYGNCDTCGNPLSEEDIQADFDRRANMIHEALDSADDQLCEVLLTMFLGMVLAGVDAEDRKSARRCLIRDIDRETKDWVLRACDA